VSDDLGLFGESDVRQDERPRGAKAARPTRRTRKRAVLWTVFALILAVGGVGAYYGYRTLSGIGSYEDYPGTGEADVVVEVKDGDPVTAIASALEEKDVVASARAFTEAGKGDSRVTAIQPGFYQMKTRMSGQAAVERMIAPGTKFVPLEVRGGNVLHDITGVDGKVVKGILSMLSEASCAELDGVKKCVSPQELRDAAENADAAALGIPEWALGDFARSPREHRLEGLIVPGLYHPKPGATATELLKGVIETSTTRLQGYGIPGSTAATGFRPYEVLGIASLVEKEGLRKDFGRISQVIYKRLSINQKLEFDSTVNYKLDRPIVTTSDEDRNRSGPYNTYQVLGLPPTPIGSPSREAIAAAINPEPGEFLFFVKCQKDGTTCFSDSLDEHERLAAKAREEGVF